MLIHRDLYNNKKQKYRITFSIYEFERSPHFTWIPKRYAIFKALYRTSFVQQDNNMTIKV